MTSVRMHKVNSLFKREISQIIQRDLANPRVGFTTVTHVEISSDLRHAEVRVSVMGNDDEQRITVIELNKSAGFIQHQVGQRVTIRSMPRLRFKLDRSLDAVYRVERLLGKIHDEEPTQDDADETGEDGPAPESAGKDE